MSTIIALFNEPNDLETALNNLSLADLNDDIKEVIDPGVGDNAPDALSVATIPSASTYGQAVAIPAFFDYSDLGEEAKFFQDAVKKGGRLVVLETDKNTTAKKILEQSKASRIFDSKH